MGMSNLKKIGDTDSNTVHDVSPPSSDLRMYLDVVRNAESVLMKISWLLQNDIVQNLVFAWSPHQVNYNSLEQKKEAAWSCSYLEL